MFNDVFSTEKIGWWDGRKIGQEVVVTQSKYYPGISLGQLRKSTTTLQA
jgi:hypothetical protein